MPNQEPLPRINPNAEDSLLRHKIHIREEKIRELVTNGGLDVAMLEGAIRDLNAQMPASETGTSAAGRTDADILKIYLGSRGLSRKQASDFLLSMLDYRKRIEHESVEELVEARSLESSKTSAIRTGVSDMSCYICTQLATSGSTGRNDGIGGCDKCNVFACSNHGARYGMFECTICTPATGAVTGMTGGVGGSAASQANAIGRDSNPLLQNQVEGALRRVTEDSQRSGQQVDERPPAVPESGSPNLLTNLADAIRQQRAENAEPIRAVREDHERSEFISIDAISGAVRERFTGMELTMPSQDAVRMVTGALLLGYRLANAGMEASGGYTRLPWPRGITSLPRPWLVTHPILLDPVLWLLGTALPES